MNFILWRPYGKGEYNLPKGMDAFFITNTPYTHKRNFFSRKRKRWKYARTSRTRDTKRASIIPYLYKNSFAGAYIGSRLRIISKYSSYDKM
jgi:hypothetical protein